MPIDLDDAVALALTGARRIAVVGASPHAERHSHTVMAALLEHGYDVVPVNPTVDEVLGRRAYPDLASVPGRIDLVDVFRPVEHLAEVARQAVARPDVAVVWNQLGLTSPEARQVVRGAGRGYVEDRCLQVEVRAAGHGPPTGPRLEHPFVLLDLDDTVLDHDACERSAVTATLVAFDLPADDASVDTYVEINARHWERYWSGAVSADELRLVRWEDTLEALGEAPSPDRVATISEAYLQRFRGTGVLLPRAAEAVWWLRRRCAVGVVTNGFAGVQAARLERARLGALVDVVVSSEEVGAAKPDPVLLRTALTRIGGGDELRPDGTVDGDRVAVVGDQLVADVGAGTALGATTVWVAPRSATLPADGPRPTHRVASVADLA